MDIQIFTAPEGQEIRAIMRDGEPWFVAADITRNLEIENTADSIGRLDEDEHTLVSTEGIPGAKNPFIRFVSESGLYSLILGSRKPEAKKFKRWVTGEVLPQIRKTGSYSIGTPRTFAQALRLAAEQQEAIEYAQAQLEAQRPAVEFVQHFVEAKQTQPLRVVAKVLKVQERKFVAALLEHGVLYRIGGKLTPAAEHMEAERFEVKELVVNGDRATTQMRFTPKGVEWIARKVQEWALTA